MIKSEKHFNTAGPVNKESHYKLNPLDRWDLKEVMNLINNQKYFLLHAPRQSGKTSCLLALRDKINAEDNYCCLYVNIESARGAKNNIEAGIRSILTACKNEIRVLFGRKQEIKELVKDIIEEGNFESSLNDFLYELSEFFGKPFILLIDEIDALHGDLIISVLSQLRAGYANRGDDFPHSIMLTGVLDIKDYRLLNIDPKHITGGSCFNIKSESLTIGNFSRDDIEKLYLEHTKETGQVFENEVFDYVYEYTDGQPWLVNALAFEVCFKMQENRDRKIAITAEMMEDAKERLILSRQTHLDQLVDKLQQERVYKVIQPMFSGLDTENEDLVANIMDEQYCIDLGLIKNSNKGLVIANKIYQEVLPRELTFSMQRKFLSIFNPEWINNDESLNVEKLLTMFLQFWRENSEIWSKRIKGYVEAAPHLIFQSFLQRVGNGKGKIDREYGLGKARADLYMRWNSPLCEQRIIIELKMRTKKQNTEKAFIKLQKEGLEQTAKYADKCNATESHLIIFDRRENIDWKDKIFTETVEASGNSPLKYKIKVWGM